MAQFKTRARALDLLGRQQIAGIPTAINELIKNAHDAYADNFDIDFFRKNSLLLLRDDGLGMTKDEFENRWLTIGTESKFTKDVKLLPPVDKSKPRRQIMGEKGIGRLAIASIGKQVLILTKAKGREKEYPIVAVLINWSIFELPNINLEDIAIPIKEFDHYPSQKDIESLKKELIESLKSLRKAKKISDSEFLNISETTEKLSFDPKAVTDSLIGNFKLEGARGGTHFFVTPVNDLLIDNIEDGKSNEASKIEKLLIGFHNTITPGHPDPVININFRDYKGEDGTYSALIEEEEFFTPEDFEMSDHQFEGTFDDYGQFKGNVSVFREKNYEHIVTWNGNGFRPTQCGSFKINFAYLQGDAKTSTVDKTNWTRLYHKGDKFGGIYIYRDNIRILPYGDSDYDFLDIEKNRSKRASTAFFSYRRMFGAIELTNADNYNLSEKAGREGFIENKAYRQLQDILKNFFTQLAADFFDDKGKTIKSEFWYNRKEELQRNHKALEKRDQLSRGKKNRFSNDLSNFFNNLTNEVFVSDINIILLEANSSFNALIYEDNLDKAGQLLVEYENVYRQKITNYKKDIRVLSPRGFAPTKDQRKDYELYLKEFSILERLVIEDALQKIDAYISDVTTKLNLEVDKRRRLELAVESISQLARKENSDKRKETQEVVRDVSAQIKDLTSDLMIDLENQILQVKDSFKNLSLRETSQYNLVEERKRMEDEIDLISNRNKTVMDKIIRQFTSFYINKDDDGNIITDDDISNAMSEELEELRDRVQADVELSQLGLAVGVLHHEFSSTIKSIRGSLKDLKAWSDVNEQLDGVYNNIKINFEHLDGYLNLFTPLNRRMNRKREEISLLEIKTFLIDLFKSRFERHTIQLLHTNGFKKHRLFGFKSTFYPVFVNLIDNAIYWLNKSNADNKIIRLHADDEGVYISNNGVEIPIQDSERIFELGFSRKESGRGMGLNISREVLQAENYEIKLDKPRPESSVTFKISKTTEND